MEGESVITVNIGNNDSRTTRPWREKNRLLSKKVMSKAKIVFL